MKRLSLQAYFFICLGVMAALPALILGVIQTQRWEALQVQQANRQSLFTAQALARAVGQKLEAHVQGLEALARQVEVAGSLDPPTLQRMVTAHRASFAGLSLTYIGDAQGRSVAVDPPFDPDGTPNVGKDYRDRDYYQKVVQTGRTSVSQVQVGRSTQVPNIQIATPIWDAAGTFVAFAEVSVNLTDIQTLAERVVGGTLA